jgi:hypothetical protein
MEPMEGKIKRASNLGTIRKKLYRIAGLAIISTGRCVSATRQAANPCA